jgi:hypothetical protein
MSDESTPNDMKRRAQEALARKLAAKSDAQASGKTSDKSGSAAKGAKQPKQRIIRHQGR